MTVCLSTCTANIKKVKWKKSVKCVSISSFGSLHIKIHLQYADLALMKIKVENHFGWQPYKNFHFPPNEWNYSSWERMFSQELYIWTWIQKRLLFTYILLFSLQHGKGLFKGGNSQKAQPVLDYQELTVAIFLMKYFESWWQAFTGLVWRPHSYNMPPINAVSINV